MNAIPAPPMSRSRARRLAAALIAALLLVTLVPGGASAQPVPTFALARAEVDRISADGGITEGLESKVRHALDTAEAWLALPGKRGPALSHLDRAIRLIEWQISVIAKGKPQGDADRLAALQATIQDLYEDLRPYTTPLSAAEEVPPNASTAHGRAVFTRSSDGSSVDYEVYATIDNVHMAHIHIAPAGANGPVAVWLYPEDGPPAQLIPGRHVGLLARGTITAGDLVGPLAGQPVAALVTAIRAGNAYVNVHTTLFPAGEIRGQIR